MDSAFFKTFHAAPWRIEAHRLRHRNGFMAWWIARPWHRTGRRVLLAGIVETTLSAGRK